MCIKHSDESVSLPLEISSNYSLGVSVSSFELNNNVTNYSFYFSLYSNFEPLFKSQCSSKETLKVLKEQLVFFSHDVVG